MDKKSAETEGTEDEDKQESPEAETVPESGENSNSGTNSTQREQPEAKSTSGSSAQWVDSMPNLEGDAKDLKDGQLTVVEFVTEKADNGGDIMVSPGSGEALEGKVLWLSGRGDAGRRGSLYRNPAGSGGARTDNYG